MYQLYFAFAITALLGLSRNHVHGKSFPDPGSKSLNIEYESEEFWVKDAQNELEKKKSISGGVEKEAKNIIFFVGAGMSVTTITAARILKGQMVDNLPFGEEAKLNMDSFPWAGMSKTFCSDGQVGDGGCTATALLCGSKANIGPLGLSSVVQRGNCSAQAETANHLSSILAWAQAGGKSTGIVSTSTISEAGCASTYAHAADWKWESDSDVRASGGDPSLCPDIASQLILSEPGRNINVILGGGRLHFLPNTTLDPESKEPGHRADRKDLIQEYLRIKKNSSFESTTFYVTTKEELAGVKASFTDYLLGLFAPKNLAYFHEQNSQNDPSLQEMTVKAIEILRKNPNGFFLFVSGGKIDEAHHQNLIQRALWETIEFDKAVGTGDEMTSDEDTLIVVAADHASVLTFAADSPRGNPILGIAQLGDDGLPYGMLGYANGPGYRNYTDGKRPNITFDDFYDLDYRPPTGIPLVTETHGGEDVLVLSKGPFAHLLSGVQQQSYIPHAMGYAACIGPGITFCSNHASSIEDSEDHGFQTKLEDDQFWIDSAQKEVRSRSIQKVIEKRAKNIIYFLGDGMSVGTITAARILKGQQVDNRTFGEEASLHMDSFPFTAMSRTFCSDSQVADSACSATAYLSGSKGAIGTVGLSPNVFRNDCDGQADKKNHVVSIMSWAQREGMGTGVISTSRITDASPSGAYAHIADRNWETDSNVLKDGYDPLKCIDIASQLIKEEPGNKFNVILSGGRLQFLPNTTLDLPSNETGLRSDGTDLTKVFLSTKPANKAMYITTQEELSLVEAKDTDYLLGLFSPGDMAWFHEREGNSNSQPTLEEMTSKAIEILERNPNGFVLFVEGAKIDSAHHRNLGGRALWETIEMDRAIKVADEMTEDEESLIVVTADHAHVMTMAGMAPRGNPILGLAGLVGTDGFPYGTIGYANGPAYREYVWGIRPDISQDDLNDIDYQQVPSIPRGTETHGGDDVLILSKGPFSHFLSGVHQQSYIPHVMGYAACIGPGMTFCSEDGPKPNSSPRSFNIIILSSISSFSFVTILFHWIL